MSPEEEYLEELKWVLGKIKKELLHAGNLVDFNASRLTNRDSDSPSLDSIYKHIKDLERTAVIRIVERYDGDGSGVYAYSLDAEAGVTGYKFEVDRSRFDKLYAKCFKTRPVETDKSFDFESEKREIEAIDSVDDHKVIAEKWFNIKLILDALNRLLSPIDTDETQVVTLYGRFLPQEQSILFRSVILDMFKAGAIGDTTRTMRPVVINSNLATKVLTGEYIPIRSAQFKSYRKRISEFVAWIYTDAARFRPAAEAPVQGTPRNIEEEIRKQPEGESIFNLKEGTKWSDIKIEFQNREDVDISISGKFFSKSNAKKMGFTKSGTKDEKINRQWEFLRQLAVVYFAKTKEGKLMMEPTIVNLSRELKMSENAVTKAKEKLAAQLSADFGIKDEDPFDDYEHYGYYKTRFELVPEPELRRGYVYQVGDKFDDSKSYRKNGQSGTDEEENEYGDSGDLME